MLGSLLKYRDDITALQTGLRLRKRAIPIGHSVNIDLLSKLWTFSILNTPEAFDVTDMRYSIISGSPVIFPQYKEKDSIVGNLLAKCDLRRKQIIEKCHRSSDYDTVLAIHDIFSRNVLYSESSSYAHTIVGPLTENRGVCDGFSKAFKYVLDSLDIPCLVVSGEAKNPKTATLEPHAWNLVQIGCYWVHIDTTFDATLSETLTTRHDYFGLDTKSILRDHVYAVEEYPAATSSELDFYSRLGQIINGKKQFNSYMEDILSSGQKDGVFKVRNVGNGVDISTRILDLATDVISQKGISATVQLVCNPVQGVYSLIIKHG